MTIDKVSLLLVHLVCAFVISSCADVSDEDLVDSPEVTGVDYLGVRPLPDSDGDGILDVNDNDPNISSIPRIVITESSNAYMKWKINEDVSLISSDFSLNNRVESDFRQVKNEFIRQKVLASVFDKIIDPNSDVQSDNLVSVEDYDLFGVSSWSETDILRGLSVLRGDLDELQTGDVSVEFNLRLENIKDVSEISHIKLQLGFVNKADNRFSAIQTVSLTEDGNNLVLIRLDGTLKTYESQKKFKLRNQYTDLSDVKDAIENEKILSIKILDFEYIKKGKKLLYSQSLASTDEKTARFIISDPNSTEIVQMIPRGTVLSSLKYLRTNIKLSASGTVLGASNSRSYLPNSLFVNDVDLHKLLPNEINLGLWKTIPLGTSINDRPVAGNVYSIIYGKAKSLVSSKKVKSSQEGVGVNESVDIISYAYGDKIIYEISAFENKPNISASSYTTKEEVWEKQLCRDVDEREGRGEMKARRICWQAQFSTGCSTRQYKTFYTEEKIQLNTENYSKYLNVRFGKKSLEEFTGKYTLYSNEGSLYILVNVDEEFIQNINISKFHSIAQEHRLLTGMFAWNACPILDPGFKCISCASSSAIFNGEVKFDYQLTKFGTRN